MYGLVFREPSIICNEVIRAVIAQTRNKCDFSDVAGARVELLEGATFVYINALGISD